MILDQVLELAISHAVSDVIMKAGSVPRMRFAGKLFPVSNVPKLSNDVMFNIVNKILPKRLEQSLSVNGDVDFSYQYGQARFRVNLYKERQRFGIAFRLIKSQVPSMRELGLPKIVGMFAKQRRGLLLVTGATGSGKSTTVANLIEQINHSRAYHIVTIEDPIEYVFEEKNSAVSQREIGIDALSMSHAMRAALRQNPDVIFVGELRDRETVETALKAAETGHLVFSTLHTTNCTNTLTRILSYFEPSQHANIRTVMSRCLNGTVSQRLVPATNNRLVCAFEVMVANSHVRECLAKKEGYDDIVNAINEGKEEYGMISFDRSLYHLHCHNLITKEVALSEATSPADLELKLRGVG